MPRELAKRSCRVYCDPMNTLIVVLIEKRAENP